jgi:hypothetical protein
MTLFMTVALPQDMALTEKTRKSATPVVVRMTSVNLKVGFWLACTSQPTNKVNTRSQIGLEPFQSFPLSSSLAKSGLGVAVALSAPTCGSGLEGSSFGASFKVTINASCRG